MHECCVGKVGMQGHGSTAWESWVGEGRLEKDGGREGWEGVLGGREGREVGRMLSVCLGTWEEWSRHESWKEFELSIMLG